MTSYHNTAHRIAELERENAVLSTRLAAYGRSHLGILSGPAIRYELSLLTTPVDMIACDWRKLHEWNEILGYDISNTFLAEFAQTRHGHDRRRIDRATPSRRAQGTDLRGQFGGDELVFAVEAGQGMGLLMRLVRALDTLSTRLTDAQRAAIIGQTNGLIESFACAFVLVERSTDAYHQEWDGVRWRDAGDVARAVTECGTLKAGAVTGSRATSGRAGTIVTSLEAS